MESGIIILMLGAGAVFVLLCAMFFRWLSESDLRNGVGGRAGRFVFPVVPAMLAMAPVMAWPVMRLMGFSAPNDRDVVAVTGIALFPVLYLVTPFYLYMYARYQLKVDTEATGDKELGALRRSPALFTVLLSIVNAGLIFGGCTVFFMRQM